MEYSIISVGGKQYRVKEGDKIEVDSFDPKKTEIEKVLLMVNDGKITMGKPFVKGANLKIKNLGNKKGKKVRVEKYKSKVRYRKAQGFRASLTILEIGKLVIK